MVSARSLAHHRKRDLRHSRPASSGRGSLRHAKETLMPAQHEIVGLSRYQQGPWDCDVSAAWPWRLTSLVIESERANRTSTQIQVI